VYAQSDPSLERFRGGSRISGLCWYKFMLFFRNANVTSQGTDGYRFFSQHMLREATCKHRQDTKRMEKTFPELESKEMETGWMLT
jgi:hypothetical protein